MSKKDDEKSKKEFQRECERYLFKKLEELSEFDKRFTQELEGKYRMWVTVEMAMKIIGKSRSTIYKYKEENRFIYRQNERKIMIYTKSLIFVL